MKLVYCPTCGDVVRLIARKWRRCDCGASGGQYNVDLMTATIGGRARVFGVGNLFFENCYEFMTPENRGAMWAKVTGGPQSAAWWGGGPKDTQIFRINSARGPRIAMRVGRAVRGRNRLTITDRRDYRVAGRRMGSVVVPANPRPSFKGRR